MADFLVGKGYTIVKRNFTIRGGEIDIIAEKDGVLCFVEVKTRSEGALVSGEQAVNMEKRKAVARTAQAFLLQNSGIYGDMQCRFDVASVIIKNGQVVSARYYVSAFDAHGLLD